MKATTDAVELPILVLEPRRAWVGLDLKEVWSYRELLFFLTWRDIKVRYKQTLLGAAWAIIQPLFLMLVFTLFFGRLAGMPSDGIPYPLFAYAGLLPWTFASNAVLNSGNSLVGSSHLVTKVYFPRIIIPGAAVLAGLLDYCIAGILLFALMGWWHVSITWRVLALFPLAVLATLLGLGVGTLDVRSERQVPRRPLRASLPHPALDVRYPDHLSRQPGSGALAIPRVLQPDGRNRRGPPGGVPGPPLDQALIYSSVSPALATVDSYHGSPSYRGHAHAQELFTAELPAISGQPA